MAITKDRFDQLFAKVANIINLSINGNPLTANATELNYLAGVAPGVVAASLAAIYDGAGKLRRSSASPAAAGSTVSDATALTAELNAVTGADGTKGVVLPIAAADEIVEIVNTDNANSLKVYAVTGSQINALGSTVAFILLPGQAAIFIARSATLWYTAQRKTVFGQHTMLSAADTFASGLAVVTGIVVSMESDPILTCDRATGQYGNQAGAPAAGSVVVKVWMPTGAALTTPIAATGYSGIKVNYAVTGY